MANYPTENIMDNSSTQLTIAGTFFNQHIRNGKVIHEEKTPNLFINEGLIYALNCAFGTSVSAVTQISDFYIGLTTASRTWDALDKADDSSSAGIHTVGSEFISYTVSANTTNRPAWAPQALASRPSTITLSDSGFEATYDITGDDTIVGAFLIDEILKNGSGDDASSSLIAGSNFSTPRAVEIGDVFKVGYILTAASGS